MPPPSELLEEMEEEALLRFPPDDPACLFRATLVCKRWCRLISGPRFRRQFREFHGTPPLLGAIYHGTATRFRPACSFRPPYAADRDRCLVIDARHGRILYYDEDGDGYFSDLVVANPVTGYEQRLLNPHDLFITCSCSAAFLCAEPGCDHLVCPSGGPFSVVFVGTDQSQKFTFVRVYSSEASKWSWITSVQHPRDYISMLGSGSALVQNAICFMFAAGDRILEYDFGRQEPTVITLPFRRNCITLKDGGGLGFGYMQDFKLHLWSRESGLNRWAVVDTFFRKYYQRRRKQHKVVSG